MNRWVRLGVMRQLRPAPQVSGPGGQALEDDD